MSDKKYLLKEILKKQSQNTQQVEYTLFFISNTFISNAKLKLAKNQANAKQHSQAELLLFEDHSHSSSTFSSKSDRTCYKK